MSGENAENVVNSGTNDPNGGSKDAQGQETSKAPEKDPTAELQQKLQETEKKYLYLYADFENFRRRAETERLNYIKFGHEGMLREMLQVLDNFDRGIEQARGFNPEKGSPLAQILQGLEMIQYQFRDSLKNQGVTEVQSLGKKFDPAFHEAIAEEESKDAEPGTVLREHSRGYLLHGRLLRPARVVTAKKVES